MAACPGEEIFCQYCLQSLPFMSDPRTLPCGHIFCITCLEADYRELRGAVKCPVCRKLYDGIDIGSLPQVNSQSAADGITTTAALTQYLCYVCKDQHPVGYCVACGLHACSAHLKNHEELEHKTIDLHVFEDKPDVYAKILCPEHGKEIAMVCEKCQLFQCQTCDPETFCDDHGEVVFQAFAPVRTLHHFVSMRTQQIEIERKFDEVMATCAEKITEVCKLEKELWLTLDKHEDTDLNQDKRETLDDLTSKVVNFVNDLMIKKDNLEEALRSARQFLRVNHVSEIIKEGEERRLQLSVACEAVCGIITKREEKIDELEKAFRQMAVSPNRMPDDAELVAYFAGLARAYPFQPPIGSSYKSLRFDSEHETPDYCYCVSYQPDGDLAVACNNMIYTYDDEWDVVGSIKARYASSVVASNDKIYFIDEYRSGTVKKRNIDTKDFQSLMNFEISDDALAAIAVSDEYVALRPPTQTDVVIYHLDTGRRLYVHGIINDPSAIFFHPDGDLLVADRDDGTLSKFTATDLAAWANPDEVWECDGLKEPCSICTDENGYIFVGSGEKKVIYVISPYNGDIVGRLSHHMLPTNPGGMSISGDTLAIACNDEDCFKIFTFR